MTKGAARNVIKSSSTSRTGVLKNRMLEAEKSARRIVSDAERRARRLVEDSQTEAKKAITVARNHGREDALEQFNSLLLEAAEVRKESLQAAEKELLALSIKIAEKIIGRELERDPETLLDIVEAALENARQKQNIVIRVNSNDLALVQDNLDRLKASSRSHFVDVAVDPRVEQGGCLIESEVGTVDARLETQLKVLERALIAFAEGERTNPSE